jgi:O-antigen ligase
MMPRVNMAVALTRVSGTSLLRYSRWALAITAGCLPLYVVRYQVGPVPTTVLENLVLLTIALYVVGRIQAGTWVWPRSGLEIPTAALLLAGAIAIFVAPDHRGAVGIYRAYFVEPVILFYIAIDLLRTPHDFRVVLLGLALGSTIFAVLNYGAWVIALMNHTVAIANAPEALYTSPNQVALYFEPPLAIAAGFALYANDQRDRRIAFVVLALLLVALILTLSRGALLTLAALAAVAVVSMPQRRLKLALLGGALIGGLIVSRIPPVAQRLANQFDPSYRFNTFEGRVQIWSDTLNMLRDHPIFGAGLRAYTQVMAPYVTHGRTPELYPHNIYLAMWSELGLLGLAGFLILMALMLWRGWRAFARATGFHRALLWGTAASFVTVAVHGLVDTPIYKNDLATLFWIVAALQVAAIAALNSAPPTARGPRS